MVDLSTLAIVWRVGVAVFVIIAPTFLFLQFMRFLEWIRDDDLIARLVEQHELETTDTNDMLAALAAGPSPEAGGPSATSGGGDALVRCGNCGQRNPKEGTYCAGCLNKLD